jgi:hypothetical protein
VLARVREVRGERREPVACGDDLEVSLQDRVHLGQVNDGPSLGLVPSLLPGERRAEDVLRRPTSAVAIRRADVHGIVNDRAVNEVMLSLIKVARAAAQRFHPSTRPARTRRVRVAGEDPQVTSSRRFTRPGTAESLRGGHPQRRKAGYWREKAGRGGWGAGYFRGP